MTKYVSFPNAIDVYDEKREQELEALAACDSVYNASSIMPTDDGKTVIIRMPQTEWQRFAKAMRAIRGLKTIPLGG